LRKFWQKDTICLKTKTALALTNNAVSSCYGSWPSEHQPEHGQRPIPSVIVVQLAARHERRFGKRLGLHHFIGQRFWKEPPFLFPAWLCRFGGFVPSRFNAAPEKPV
jgi:hypothetical protein